MIPAGFINLSGINIFAITTGQITLKHIIGTWVAAFLTICIFSFLYDDNPLYKFAEHLFVGVSAGYIIATTYRNVMIPNLYGNIKTGVLLLVKTGSFEWRYWSFILAGVMGIMLLMKLVPSLNWLARWPLSFMVGTASGLGIVFTMEALVLKQIDATVVPLLVRTASQSIQWSSTVQNWLIVLGVCSGLVYFYFSKEHKGLFYGTFSRIGIYVLLMADMDTQKKIAETAVIILPTESKRSFEHRPPLISEKQHPFSPVFTHKIDNIGENNKHNNHQVYN